MEGVNEGARGVDFDFKMVLTSNIMKRTVACEVKNLKKTVEGCENTIQRLVVILY